MFQIVLRGKDLCSARKNGGVTIALFRLFRKKLTEMERLVLAAGIPEGVLNRPRQTMDSGRTRSHRGACLNRALWVAAMDAADISSHTLITINLHRFGCLCASRRDFGEITLK